MEFYKVFSFENLKPEGKAKDTRSEKRKAHQGQVLGELSPTKIAARTKTELSQSRECQAEGGGRCMLGAEGRQTAHLDWRDFQSNINKQASHTSQFRNQVMSRKLLLSRLPMHSGRKGERTTAL